MTRGLRWTFASMFAPVILLFIGIRPGEAQSISDPTARIAAEFAPIEGPGNLFRIDDNYVLQPLLQAQSLVAIKVLPKYFFQDTHPNWIEPDDVVTMPMERFSSLLSHLDRVQGLGARVGAVGDIRITANNRTHSWEEYDSGIVDRALFRPSPDEQYSVAWFTIWYLRSVSGTVTSVNPKDQLYGRSVRIDGKTYWATLEELGRLSPRASGVIEAAGPIGDDR